VSRNEPSVQLGGEDGPVTVSRELLVDALRTAMEKGADEAKADEKATDRLLLPIELLKEGARKLKRALEAYQRVKSDDEFKHGDFAYFTKKAGLAAKALKDEVDKADKA
jgi:hypothetical protein